MRGRSSCQGLFPHKTEKGAHPLRGEHQRRRRLFRFWFLLDGSQLRGGASKVDGGRFEYEVDAGISVQESDADLAPEVAFVRAARADLKDAEGWSGSG
jgi:hypothetical protein